MCSEGIILLLEIFNHDKDIIRLCSVSVYGLNTIHIGFYTVLCNNRGRLEKITVLDQLTFTSIL